MAWCWADEIKQYLKQWWHFSIAHELISPNAVYMRQWIESALVEIMACRLFNTKPLSKPMLAYSQLDDSIRNSVILIHKNAFEIVVYQVGGHFVPVGDELMWNYISPTGDSYMGCAYQATSNHNTDHVEVTYFACAGTIWSNHIKHRKIIFHK